MKLGSNLQFFMDMKKLFSNSFREFKFKYH